MGKKILFFIATEKGYTALRRFTTRERGEQVGCVITFKENNVDKSWDQDISRECLRNNIPCFMWTEAKNQLPSIIQANGITGAVTISWRYLLPLSINRFLEDKLIVFHDSLLPRYRGFAPTPTAIICGEREIGVTALFATNIVDQGDIVMQRSVIIPQDMYIADIIKKQSELCADMLESLIEQMEQGTLVSCQQDEKEATYSIWRNSEDCHIDWKKPALDIYNFVRALGKPYPGAYAYLEDRKIEIVRTIVVGYDLNFALRDCGKIWSIQNNEPEVICGVGMLKIQLALDDHGKQVRFTKVRCRLK